VKRALNSCLGFLLAFNYFTFQVEPFENEYEENHPPPSRTLCISCLSVTWESFDKENAPPAFRFDGGLEMECVLCLLPLQVSEAPAWILPKIIRDKSPPPAPASPATD